MAKIDIHDEKPPASLQELEDQLDVEDAHDAPPHPRQSGASKPKTPEPDDDTITDAELQDAVAAADEAQDEPTQLLNKQSLHIEANPDAPKVHFWKRKKFWVITIIILFIALALAWFIRPSRLYLINLVGMRADITITTATLPDEGQSASLIKNVVVHVGDTQVTTDDQGVAHAKVKYGDVVLSAQKTGYADATQTVLVDYDPFFHKLGGAATDEAARHIDLQLKAVGVRAKFETKDWLTDQPITIGTFSIGDIIAKPDDTGAVNFTLPATDDKTVHVKAVFGGVYTDKEFEIKLDGSSQIMTFVPAGRDYFITNRGGLALYASDIDGGNLSEVVPASPNETAAMAVAVSPSGKFAVMASTREAKRDFQGNVLQQLYIVDLATKKLTPLDQALWFNFVDWSGDTLAYTAGELLPKASETTQRLASINVATSKQTTIGTATFYGNVRVALGNVIYQVGYAQNQDGFAGSPELRVTPLAGGTEKNLGYKVQHIVQAEIERTLYQTSDGVWHEYSFNTAQSKNASAPANPSRAFMATPTADGQTRLVVDITNGKTSLVAKSVGNGQEKLIFADTRISGPIRLVGAVVVFRMGSADYAVPLTGGTPKKITDVTVPLAPIPRPTAYFVFF